MPALRLLVDRDLCEANAVCVRLAPEVFRIDPAKDVMELLQEVPDESQLKAAENAVRMCPRGALTLGPIG